MTTGTPPATLQLSGELTVPLQLSGELTVQTAAATMEVLMAHLADAGQLVLDLSAVSELDTAGLQLLLVAKREAEGAGMAFSLLAPSSAVQEVLALARLDGALDDLGDVQAAPATGEG